jgi:hypothetical protein
MKEGSERNYNNKRAHTIRDEQNVKRNWNAQNVWVRNTETVFLKDYSILVSLLEVEICALKYRGAYNHSPTPSRIQDWRVKIQTKSTVWLTRGFHWPFLYFLPIVSCFGEWKYWSTRQFGECLEKTYPHPWLIHSIRICGHVWKFNDTHKSYVRLEHLVFSKFYLELQPWPKLLPCYSFGHIFGIDNQ